MKQNLKRIVLTLVIVLLAVSIIAASPPIMPSSFWGYVQGGQPGDVITASIDGQVRATAQAVDYNGALVYSVNVPGTSADQNKQIVFAVNDIDVAATLWQSGTNRQVDLPIGDYIQDDRDEAEPEVEPAPDVPEGKPYVEPPRPEWSE